MTSDQFTVLLDKRESHKANGVELGDAVLRGKCIYKEGSLEVADSMEALLSDGLIAVPTYRLIGGRAFADNEYDAAWKEHCYTLAERITAYDQKGILGAKRGTYAMDIQNGGIFVLDHHQHRPVQTL